METEHKKGKKEIVKVLELEGHLITVETRNWTLDGNSFYPTLEGALKEMSNRILIMADNIGLMADRIITTQMIQSQNLALTQSSILLTQQNMVLLSDSLSTIAYNLTLGQIIDNAEVRTNTMNVTSLNS